MGSRLDNPFPDSYDVDLSDVEADSSGETEAGTIFYVPVGHWFLFNFEQDFHYKYGFFILRQ